MTDTALTKDQGIALLTRLASDEGFRGRYEKSPGAALAEIVPPATLAQVSAESLKPVKLADKAAFGEALKHLRNDAADVCLCQQPPTIRLNLGR